MTYKILIVDDDALVRQFLRDSLLGEGYQIIEAGDGCEAISVAEDKLPDLIIMDIVMPRMDGLSACQLIRETVWGAQIPIVILTALEDEESIKQAELAGATDILLKPIRLGLVKHRARFLIKSNKSYTQTSLTANQLYEVLEKIPDPLVVYNEKMEILWANRHVEDYFGKPRENIVGKKCVGFCLGTQAGECDECLARLTFRKRQTLTGVKHGEGGKVWGVRTFPILGENGDCQKVVKLSHDITEKVKLQADAAHTSQLGAIGELAAGVAHEINNPIGGIINYSQIILNKMATSFPEYELVKKINSEGERIVKIVDSLLALSRRGGKGQYDVESCSNLANETLALIDTQLAQEHICPVINIPESLKPVRVKKHAIQQVIINLINNSRHALHEKWAENPDEKVIYIVAAEISIGDIDYVCLEIRDNGIGIAEEQLNVVKMPFYTTKENGEGTGIGLSISHKIIADHGGELLVESKAGEGTAVKILLRCHQGVVSEQAVISTAKR